MLVGSISYQASRLAGVRSAKLIHHGPDATVTLCLSRGESQETTCITLMLEKVIPSERNAKR